MWLYVSEAARNKPVVTVLKLAGSLLVLGALVVLALASESSAASTEVRALVCDESQPMTKSLSITSPASDVVLNDPKISLRGDVENIGQIEVYLNDAFDHALSLPIGAESFESTVQVAVGTTTIRVVGQEATGCDQEQISDEVVITFQPRAVNAEEGVQQRNDVTPATEVGGVRIGPPLEGQTSDQPASLALPGVTLLAPLIPLMGSLDLASFVSISGQASSAIFLIGAFCVLPAVFVAGLPPLRAKQLLAIGLVLMLVAFLVG